MEWNRFLDYQRQPFGSKGLLQTRSSPESWEHPWSPSVVLQSNFCPKSRHKIRCLWQFSPHTHCRVQNYIAYHSPQWCATCTTSIEPWTVSVLHLPIQSPYQECFERQTDRSPSNSGTHNQKWMDGFPSILVEITRKHQAQWWCRGQREA